MSHKGLFITVEGVDGSGKSTQMRRLGARLRAEGHEVVETREPGGSAGAEEIRRLVLTGDPGRWSPTTEMLLFFAARRDNMEKTIRPALEAGAVVLCDRWTDSTRAYQAGARPTEDGATRAQIDLIHERVIGLDPDLTLIFDLDPAEALARGLARETDEARFERLGDDFQHRMRRVFHDIAKARPETCAVINAAGAEEEVATRVWNAVAPRL